MPTEALFDSSWLALVHPPNVLDDPRVKAAEEFKNDAEAKPDRDYGWVWDYAKDAYERKMAVRDSHDNKAAEIIKYIGGGAGLLTLASLLKVEPETKFVLAWAFPSFVFTLISLFFAMLARKPNHTYFPPTIAGAKRYADYFETEREATAAFIGQWHYAAEALSVANGLMADRVEMSIKMLFVAVSLLLLPIGAAIFG